MTLDQLGPQTYAPKAGQRPERNSKPAFDFWVNDDLSEKAKVTIVVKNGAGTTVKKPLARLVADVARVLVADQ